jgi:hypothetical protein
MTEPRRFLLDDTPGAASNLLRSAAEDAPSDEVRAKVAAAIGLGAAPQAPSNAGSAAVPRPLGWKQGLFGKIVIGLACLGAVGLLALLLDRRPAPAPAPALQPSAVPADSAPAADPPRVPLTPASAATQAEPSPPASTPASVARPAAVPSAPARTLAEEVASLDRARSALSSGGAAAALAELNRHDKEFPRGALSIEAMVLRIEVLSRSNRPAAVSMARSFLRSQPSSPYRARILSLVPEVAE